MACSLRKNKGFSSVARGEREGKFPVSSVAVVVEWEGGLSLVKDLISISAKPREQEGRMRGRTAMDRASLPYFTLDSADCCANYSPY